MPKLKTQMLAAAKAGGLNAPIYVARLLTPLGMSYEKAVKTFEPYTSVKAVNSDMRDDAVRLAKRAVQRDVPLISRQIIGLRAALLKQFVRLES